jgi:hypothetical protein
VSLRQGDRWTSPERLVECTEKNLESLFGAAWRDLDARGLCAPNAPFGIFRVKKGAVIAGHTFMTGYFGFLLLGGSDLYRL